MTNCHPYANIPRLKETKEWKEREKDLGAHMIKYKPIMDKIYS